MNTAIIQSSLKPRLASECLIQVERSVSELRRGRALPITSDRNARLVAAIETIDPEVLEQFQAAPASSTYVLITGQRAKRLGFSAPEHETIYRLSSPNGLPIDGLRAITDPIWSKDRATLPTDLLTKWSLTACDEVDAMCIKLIKHAELLPAAIVTDLKDATDAGPWSVLSSQILQGIEQQARSLQVVSEAQVPLEDAELARIVAFRPTDGGTEHLAIVVGEPDLTQPVLIRMHSECFTGDLLGSLRCDCGPQLRGAIAQMAQAGSGILLYLAQEGRGIGLINKLRAYQLQDAGLDTVDANLALGFEEDERDYLPAAQMLQLLGVKSVRLMTNNPRKVQALNNLGIEVVERVAHVMAANQHNSGYLFTKGTRGGHLFNVSQSPKPPKDRNQD
jgi:GTP cyclohydrolase II